MQEQYKNIEDKINKEYGLNTYDFFEDCIVDGLSIREIASILNCSISNLRRIARKYKFSFYRPKPYPRLAEDHTFKSQLINSHNFLSKKWIST